MSMTPGPWEVRGGEGDGWHNAAYGIVAENGDLVGFVTRRGTKEGLSNARAFAVVPKMVDLLKDIYAWYYEGKGEYFYGMALQVADLLRRIEGGEETK